MSLLLSWNQAPGLPRTVPSVAAATTESCRSGLSKRRPMVRLQTCLSRSMQGWEVSAADKSGVPVWEGDLEVCVFS